GRSVRALESALERLSGWLQGPAERDAEAILPAVERADDPGVDRLFHHLVPSVTGRRTGHEIINRLRSKWDLSHSLRTALDRVRRQIHALAELHGPAAEVLARLDRDFGPLAPQSVAELAELASGLSARGVDPARVQLDLGFGHGIGFYTQMIFE